MGLRQNLAQFMLLVGFAVGALLSGLRARANAGEVP
jgi:hypothetical protein